MKIKNEDFVKWLRKTKTKTNPFKKNKNKYYEFLKDHGHNTKNCFQLKEHMVDLIKMRYLRKFVVDRPWPDSPDKGYADNRPTTGDIQTIRGGFESRGCSTSFRKRNTR